MFDKIQKSLANRISIVISLVLVVIFFLLASFCYDYATKELTKYTISNTELGVRLISDKVSNIFENAKIVTDQIGFHSEITSFLHDVQNREQLNSHPSLQSIKNTLVEIKESNPYLFTSWVGNKNASFYYDNFGILPDETYDVTQRPWYNVAINADGVDFTPPYVEWGTGKIVVNAVKALRLNNQVYGFAGVEISLEQIPAIFDSYATGNSDINFLLSNDGLYIYNKDADKIMVEGINTIGDPLHAYKDLVYSNSNTLYPVQYDNTDYLLMSSVITNSNWRIVTLINKEVIDKKISDLLTIIIWIFSFTVLLSIFIIKYIVTRSIKPYKVLVNFAKHIAEGDFSQNIPSVYVESFLYCQA